MRLESVSSPRVIQKAQIDDRGGNLLEEEVKANQTINEETLNSNNRKEITEEEIIKAIEKANKEFVIYDRKFEFSIHEETKEIMVKVINAKTDEVIREIPPEKILDMIARMWELAGILVDEKV